MLKSIPRPPTSDEGGSSSSFCGTVPLATYQKADIYRKDPVTYVISKALKYVKTKRMKYLDALHAAVCKAHAKNIAVYSEPLRLAIYQTAYEHAFSKTGSFKFSVKDRQCSFSSSSTTTWSSTDSGSLICYLPQNAASGKKTVFPTKGTWLFKAKPHSAGFSVKKSKKGQKKRKGYVFQGLYDASDLVDWLKSEPGIEAMAATSVASSGKKSKRLVYYKVPLYARTHSSLQLLTESKLPQAEVHILLKVSQKTSIVEQSLRAVGAKLVINGKADSHSILATSSWYLESCEHWNVNLLSMRNTTVAGTGGAQPVQTTDKATTSGASFAPLSNISSTAVHAPLDLLFDKLSPESLSKDRLNFSYGVVQGESVRMQHNAGAMYRVGEVTQILIALAVKRQVSAINKSGTPLEQLLADADTLRALLTNATAEGIWNKLVKLYGGSNKTPSVLQLLTHTSGLPDVAQKDVASHGALASAILQHTIAKDAINADGFDSRRRNDALAELIEGCAIMSPAGSRVHHSTLGYAILAACIPSTDFTLNAVARQLGMYQPYILSAKDLSDDSSVSEAEAVGMYALAEELPYLNAVGLGCSCDDLCSLMKQIQRSFCYGPSRGAEPYLGAGLVPKYIDIDEGKVIDSVTNGGWDSTRVTLHVTPKPQCSMDRVTCAKHSVAVSYKFGDTPGQDNVLLCYVPALDLGVACCTRIPLGHMLSLPKSSLPKFTCKEHSKVREAQKKNTAAKTVDVRLLIKRIIQAVLEGGRVSSQFNLHADLAVSTTPVHPPQYVMWQAYSEQLSIEPSNGSQWADLLNKELVQKDLFNRDLIPVLPFIESALVYINQAGEKALVSRSKEGLKGTVREICAYAKTQVPTIKIYTPDRWGCKELPPEDLEEHIFILKDISNGEQFGMYWDDEPTVSVLKIPGSFRLASRAPKGLGEELMPIDFISGDSEAIPFISYRGRAHASEPVLVAALEEYLTLKQREQEVIQKQRLVRHKEENTPWLVASMKQTTTTYARSGDEIGTAASPIPETQDKRTHQMIATSPIVPALVGGAAGFVLGRATAPRNNTTIITTGPPPPPPPPHAPAWGRRRRYRYYPYRNRTVVVTTPGAVYGPPPYDPYYGYY